MVIYPSVFTPPGPSRLRTYFRKDPDLKCHYKQTVSKYRKWHKELSLLEVDGLPLFPYGNDLWPQLRGVIIRRDGWLTEHMAQPSVPINLGQSVTHERICEVFARNVVAGEPVEEPVKFKVACDEEKS